MRFSLVSLAVLAALVAAPRAQALQIIPTFDSTITSDPNAATIEQTINSALATYGSLFSNNVSVTIKFEEMSSGLGQSLTYVGTIPYSSFYSTLSATGTTAVAQEALAHLPNQTANPVNGSSQIEVTTADLRVLGFNAFPPVGDFDSTIAVNTSITNNSRTNIDPNKYDLKAVVMHEINEALGLGSALDGVSNGSVPPTGAIGTLDLFRYDANGVRSFSTASNALAYFSLDGTTKIEQFNQDARGDFHDWASGFLGSAQVQDAFGTPGATADLGPAELTALEAIGYNGPAVPEPTSIALFAIGLPVVVIGLRRRMRKLTVAG